MSKIAYVKTYQVAYPLDQPLSDSIHYMPVRAALLVELGTDDGEVGIGESAIYGGPGLRQRRILRGGQGCGGADRRGAAVRRGGVPAREDQGRTHHRHTSEPAGAHGRPRVRH